MVKAPQHYEYRAYEYPHSDADGFAAALRVLQDEEGWDLVQIVSGTQGKIAALGFTAFLRREVSVTSQPLTPQEAGSLGGRPLGRKDREQRKLRGSPSQAPGHSPNTLPATKPGSAVDSNGAGTIAKSA